MYESTAARIHIIKTKNFLEHEMGTDEYCHALLLLFSDVITTSLLLVHQVRSVASKLKINTLPPSLSPSVYLTSYISKGVMNLFYTVQSTVLPLATVSLFSQLNTQFIQIRLGIIIDHGMSI